MSEVATVKTKEEAMTGMGDVCSELFKEWLVDLNFEEKKIWLWNASVEMCRIKQRKLQASY
ncbi:MAG: hypothetical protein PHC54_07350 [Candidatus Omnitrophica bacterium]|nr:hypothetical protein [Candidatus Omnitrophota bacterium]MDD5593091.1 hypothetical protein [Candidatus Omnitrophota bacterium]